jgi:transcriptional regulator with GAF, ATPase, and Fis domain
MIGDRDDAETVGGGYAADFARMALELHDEPGVEQTLERVLGFALDAVRCDSAGVMLVHGGKVVETAASTDPVVEKADQLQMECGEGPCLSAIFAHDSFLVRDTMFEERWPLWAPKVADLGLRSVLSIRLHTTQSTIGALNLFDAEPDRFDADDDAVAHILARHASVALATARQESSLWEAIDARKLIGQAQGILMERFDLTDEQAFAVLRRYSQDNNLKLREVAQRLISTRKLPGSDLFLNSL